MDKMKRMQELVELLNKAGKAYYQDAQEIMSNYEYDALYDELKGLEEELGTVMASSPTGDVGYEGTFFMSHRCFLLTRQKKWQG